MQLYHVLFLIIVVDFILDEMKLDTPTVNIHTAEVTTIFDKFYFVGNYERGSYVNEPFIHLTERILPFGLTHSLDNGE